MQVTDIDRRVGRVTSSAKCRRSRRRGAALCRSGGTRSSAMSSAHT